MYCDRTETKQKYTDDSLGLQIPFSIKISNAQCTQHWVVCTIKVECTKCYTHNHLDAGNLHDSCMVLTYIKISDRYNAKYM